MKLPAYGVHFWLPKAHVEAPTGGRIVLAGVMLKLGTYGILRYSAWSLVTGSSLLFAFLVWGSFLSCLVMAFQSDLKRMAAYSSVVHMSAATAALFTWGRIGAQAAFLVALGHGFASSALFCLVGAAQESSLTRNPILVTGLRSLGRGFFLLSFFIFFARNGAPPFFSFWGEMGTIVATGLRAGPLSYSVIMARGVLCPSVYFMAYFRRIGGRATARVTPAPIRSLLGLSIHVILLVVFFFVVGPLVM